MIILKATKEIGLLRLSRKHIFGKTTRGPHVILHYLTKFHCLNIFAS